jgi:cell division protein ZapA (FtsZ GTPase activity inhibitor)
VKLTVEVTGDQEKQLADVARRLNVPADQLAAALVRDLLSQREADFSETAARVLERNRELYQRLR